LRDLPYIAEGYVLAVQDTNFKYRVAALIRLAPFTTSASEKPSVDGSSQESTVSLEKLRKDLSMSMEMYKLPTLLRILLDEETVPKARVHKILRKQAVEQYFPQSVAGMTDSLPPAVEVWDIADGPEPRPRREWDWGGIEYR
jgi:malonyl-CoA/methylmalonyl-CoA synthetase